MTAPARYRSAPLEEEAVKDNLVHGTDAAPMSADASVYRAVVCSPDGRGDPVTRLVLLAVSMDSFDSSAAVSRVADIVERTRLCERVVRDRLQRAAVVGWLIAEGSRNRRRYKLSLPYRLARRIIEEQCRERRRERAALRKEIKQTQQLLDATRLR